jgi:hypothetical protein
VKGYQPDAAASSNHQCCFSRNAEVHAILPQGQS